MAGLDGDDEALQLLTPQGQLVDDPQHPVLASEQDMLAMHRQMVLARRLDLEATNLQRQNQLGLWAPAQGQEGTQVGAGWALGPHDHVHPSYREHALALQRGVDPVDLLGLFRGTSLGQWDYEATRFEPYTLVVGAQALHAVGHAMAFDHDGLVGNGVDGDPEQNAAVLVFHGDGASSQGEVNEAYVFAASYQAPVVFICQNNHWAISEPVTRQSRIPLYRRASGFGIPGVRVDGNDVLAVQSVTAQALARARSGGGPTLVEAVTYRIGAHTTSDDPRRYRHDDEVAHWSGRDPIDRLERHLLQRGVLDEPALAWLQQESDDFGADLRTRVRELAPPSYDETFQHVYADPAPDLAAQLEDHHDFLTSLEEGADD